MKPDIDYRTSIPHPSDEERVIEISITNFDCGPLMSIKESNQVIMINKSCAEQIFKIFERFEDACKAIEGEEKQ